MSSTLNKIHVTNSTGLSLNERFTAITSQPKVVTNIGNGRRSRSRSRSVQRQLPIVKNEQVSSRANQRLLAQLQRKHKMHAALKLKRRSMRTVGRGGGSNGSGANGRIQRGSVKAFRVGANGKPLRANSFARVATMKADNESLRTRNVPLRRTNSSGNIANRLGPRRPTAGGAAQRVAKRKIERQRGRNDGVNSRLTAQGRSGTLNISRGRSRSRSRTRIQPANGHIRSRSRTRNVDNQNNNRNRSRNRNQNDGTNAPVRRGRSRSRTRGRGGIINKAKATLPVKARLGVRPVQNNSRRNTSLTRRGVQTGRVEKRRNSTNTNTARVTVGNNNRRGRPRSRSAVRNATNNSNVRPRTRSRTRKGQVGQQKQQGAGQQQQQQLQQRNNRAPRGRSQHRRGSNGKGQTQQRRGRSRSRTGRGANGGARNQGNKPAATKTAVNKDELDKELDQYMATTKTENEMDYLLKN